MAQLTITKMLVSPSKYPIKAPYKMNPSRITNHNTANKASAMAEISYMIGNNNKVSYHYAVDDYRAVQGIECNRSAYHSGDGNGNGNRTSIGVEICYSSIGGEKFDKSYDNALTLNAMLMKQYNIPSSMIFYHQNWSGKYCPHRLLDMGIKLPQFRELVQARYNQMYGGSAVTPDPVTPPVTPSTGTTYKVGDNVEYNAVASSSTSGSVKYTYGSYRKGKITRVLGGRNFPYLINGGTGWVSDSQIRGTSKPTPAPSVSYYPASNMGGLVASLNAIGVNSSLSYRGKIAEVNGIRSASTYKGSSSDNIAMSNLLADGKLKRVGSAPTPAPSANYYPKYTGSSSSIVDALSAIKVDSSYTNRKNIAKANGISGYSGSPSQNNQLVKLVKQGKLKKA